TLLTVIPTTTFPHDVRIPSCSSHHNSFDYIRQRSCPLPHQRTPVAAAAVGAVPGELDAGRVDGAAVHAVGQVRRQSPAQCLWQGSEQGLPFPRAHRRQKPVGRRLHDDPGCRRLPATHQFGASCDQGQCRHVHREGADIADESLRHHTRRRRWKDGVQWGDTAETLGPTGQPIGTFNSATFAVNAPYFTAKNITFKNTTPVPPPGAMGKQAVALRVSADAATFLGCDILGAQDTLYDHFGRHYYKDCYIEGSVDFIFGNALSLYEGCHVHAVARNYGAVTAQNRMNLLEDTGFSFVRCKVTGSGALYLGRAWGTFSRVIFAYTYMDAIIVPRGWYNWGDPNREMTVFYGQYKCSGPGARYAGRVSWSRELTDEEAKPFITLSFIDGSEWVKL
ncbi:unnamed protein product, partial [Musa textilis]